MITRRNFFFSVAALAGPVRASEGDLKIVAHPAIGVTQISAQDLRSIYLGTVTSFRKTGPVHPALNRTPGSLERFAAVYMRKSAPALEIYYRSLVFTGRWAMPPVFTDDAKMIDYVSRTRGAIGFVHEMDPSSKVLTLRVVQIER
jgi:hypothetical protein